MKQFILLIFLASIAFAVKPVPRDKKEVTTSTPKAAYVQHDTKNDTDTKKDDDKRKDRFVDSDSNGVNDKREKDFQKIKESKTKHKSTDRKAPEKRDKNEKKTESPVKKKK